MNKATFNGLDLGRRGASAMELRLPGGFDDLALDLRATWSLLYRNRYLFLVIVVLALIAGLAVTMLSTPTYTAETSVQIEEQTTRVLESDDTDLRPSTSDEERFLQTQIDVLQSRAVRQLVSDKLNLTRGDTFFLRMGLKPPAGTVGRLDAVASRREAVITILGKHLNIVLPRNSRIAQIEFTSPDPVLAAQVSKMFAQTYIMFNLQRKFDTSAYARSFVEGRLAEVKRRLEDSERALIDYARSAGLIDASNAANDPGVQPSNMRSLTVANLVQLNQAYAAATAQRVTAEQRWEQARRTPLMSLPDVATNATVQTLVQRRAEAQAAYDQDRQRRKPEFPSMQQAAAQIAELDQQVNAAARNILSGYKDQYETALKQEQGLGASLEQLKRSTLSEQDRTVRYTILRREADTNRILYDGLLQRYKELSASAGLLSNNISIVDEAPVPTAPVSPKLWINMLVALILGSILAAVVVFVREKLEDVVRLPEDVGRKLHLTHLNSVPLLPSGMTPKDALADVRSALSEAYYALRTSIELASPDGPPRLMLFTSSRQGEGKSTSASAIAQNFARTGKRVLLVDGDLRKPSLHRIIDMPRTEGLANLLARLRTVDEVIHPTATPNLDFIACGSLPPNPAELLSGASLGMVMQELRSRYDHIIIDGPPVLGLADAVLLGNMADAVIFVIQFNSSKSSQARAAIARLESGGARVLGAVLTKFDARKTGYGEEYGYAYSYGNEQPVTV